jgi:hypothetical protein
MGHMLEGKLIADAIALPGGLRKLYHYRSAYRVRGGEISYDV